MAGDGAAGRIRVGIHGDHLPGKGVFRVEAGETLIFETPGGGGFGLPKARKQDSVARDLQAGFISVEAARDIYGKTS